MALGVAVCLCAPGRVSGGARRMSPRFGLPGPSSQPSQAAGRSGTAAAAVGRGTQPPRRAASPMRRRAPQAPLAARRGRPRRPAPRTGAAPRPRAPRSRSCAPERRRRRRRPWWRAAGAFGCGRGGRSGRIVIAPPLGVAMATAAEGRRQRPRQRRHRLQRWCRARQWPPPPRGRSDPSLPLVAVCFGFLSGRSQGSAGLPRGQHRTRRRSTSTAAASAGTGESMVASRRSALMRR